LIPGNNEQKEQNNTDWHNHPQPLKKMVGEQEWPLDEGDKKQ
jgi:hypothetical protein